MWSKKPTPVARAPPPPPSPRSAPLPPPPSRPGAARSGPRDSWGGILPHPRLHRARVQLEALRARDRRARRRELARGLPADLAEAHFGHLAAKVPRREPRGEARRAARRQDVVR